MWSEMNVLKRARTVTGHWIPDIYLVIMRSRSSKIIEHPTEQYALDPLHFLPLETSESHHEPP
jgi:hypothetical protein